MDRVRSFRGPAHEDYRLNSFQANYQQLASQVAKRLSALYGSRYEIELNKMVGGLEIDLLLRGRATFAKDTLIEVKSIRKGFNFGWLRESFLKNVYAKNIYSQITNRVPNTLLLIVTEFQGETPEKYASLLTQIADEQHARKGKDRVVMLSKDELHSLSQDALQERLGMYA